MRITSKGQVTIPQDIREAAGMLPNTEVEFLYDGDIVTLVRSVDDRSRRPTRGDMVIAALQRGRPHFSMSTDEIMALTRGDD